MAGTSNESVPEMAIDIVYSQGSPIKNSHHIMKNPYLLMVKPPFPSKPSSPYLPSGKRLHGYGKSPFFMGKLIVSMAMFDSYFDITRGCINFQTPEDLTTGSASRGIPLAPGQISLTEIPGLAAQIEIRSRIEMIYYTLWLFPFIDGLPIKNVDFHISG